MSQSFPPPPPSKQKQRSVAVLAALLGAHLAVCFYSSAVGVGEAVAFVSKRPAVLSPLSGRAHRVATLFPASQQFGYFAPQVCSEFRAQVHLASSVTQQVATLDFHLPPEGARLLSSLNAATQDEAPARAIAASYASYALNSHRDYDYAFVTIEAEFMPPLRSSAALHPRWVTVRGYYFKR